MATAAQIGKGLLIHVLTYAKCTNLIESLKNLEKQNLLTSFRQMLP